MTLQEIGDASDHLYIETQELIDDILANLRTEGWWPRGEYIPPTRWQRIRSLPRRVKHHIMGAIHDRFFRDYCDHDW